MSQCKVGLTSVSSRAYAHLTFLSALGSHPVRFRRANSFADICDLGLHALHMLLLLSCPELLQGKVADEAD